MTRPPCLLCRINGVLAASPTDGLGFAIDRALSATFASAMFCDDPNDLLCDLHAADVAEAMGVLDKGAPPPSEPGACH